LQATLVASLRERDINAILVDGDVFRDHGNDLVFECLQELGRDPRPVVDKDKLQSLLGNLTARRRFGSKVFLEK
jgi:hypothetical protein